MDRFYHPLFVGSDTMSKKTFPIVDIQFHTENAEHVEERDSKEARAILTWHSTAIAYLHYGNHMGLNGPAVEVEENGKIVAREITNEISLSFDRFGNPYFRYTLKDE